MGREKTLYTLLSFWETFTVTQQEQLTQAMDNFVPGGFRNDLIFRSQYTLGSLFFPVVSTTGPSAFLQSDGIAVDETFTWEGMFYLDKQFRGNYVKVSFDKPQVFHAQTIISTEFESTYYTQYNLPTYDEILKAVTTLMIARLNSPALLFFFLKHKQRLEKGFKPVYDAIGPCPLHKGVLQRIASEPFDHGILNSQNISWSEISRRTAQSHTDILRSYDMTIRSGLQRWSIDEKEPGEKKAVKFDECLEYLQKKQLLPACVLDALHLGTNQSGFLNEAVIALGVYITEISDHQITLPQSGVKRSLRFTIRNGQVEVKDTCRWREVGAPVKANGLSILEREHVQLTKPLVLTYRYLLKADEKNRLCHQITQISLRNEDKTKAVL